MKKIFLYFLLLSSTSILSDEYFCNFKGGSGETIEGVVIFEKNQDGVLVKSEKSERTFEIIRDDEEVLLFQYINNVSIVCLAKLHFSTFKIIF